MLALIAVSAAAVIAGGVAIYYRKKAQMSQASADRLLAAGKASAAKILELEASNASLTDQLAAAKADIGVPDVVADAVSLELEQAVNPPVPGSAEPAPEPAPEAPPAA